MPKKFDFSTEQKFPFALSCVLFFLCICLFVINGTEMLLYSLFCYGGITALSLFMLMTGIISMNKIAIDNTGVAIVTSGGRKIRHLGWESIKVYDMRKGRGAGSAVKYISFSADEDFDPRLNRLWGGIVYMFMHKQTIIIPSSHYIIKYCNKQLEKHGNPLYIYSPEEDLCSENESEINSDPLKEWKSEPISQAVKKSCNATNRKYKFSSEQKIPFFLGVATVVLSLMVELICLFYIQVDLIWVLMIIFAIVLAMGIFLWIMGSIAVKSVVFDREKIIVVNRKGKESIRINWAEIRVYNTYITSLNSNTNYVILSTNKNVDYMKAGYLGGIGEMFTKPKTIIVPYDHGLLELCNECIVNKFDS